MQPLPSLSAAFVNAAGKLLSPWNSYLQQFTQAPPKFATIIVGSSPFNYKAKEPGYIFITGGTVTSIGLTRGGTLLNCGNTEKFIPVSIDDIVSLAYTVLPSMIFIPIYGASPR